MCDIDEMDEKALIEMVSEDGFMLEFVKNQTDNISLAAVRNNWHALEFVKNQTRDVILEAIYQCGLALGYVRDQSEELCIEAVRSHFEALDLVENQSRDVCLEALRVHGGWCIVYIKEPTTELWELAIRDDPGVFSKVPEDHEQYLHLKQLFLSRSLELSNET